MAVYVAFAGDVFDGVFLCCFSHEMSEMRSGNELSQFLRIFLPTMRFHRVVVSQSRFFKLYLLFI